jgi:ABC-type transport system involved in multi-copper enzyme maturation permease subunit
MATFTIARLTFHEAARRRILLAALLLGILFLVIYGLGLHFIRLEETRNPIPSVTTRNEIFNFLLLAGLYVVNFLTVMMTVLTSVDTLSGEIASGTIHTVVAKPIRRWEVVLGKWLGFVLMLSLYILMMAGGVALLVRWIGDYTPPNLLTGLSLIWINGMLMLSISLMGGTVLSTLANGVLVFGLFGIAFVGGWIEQFGSLIGNQSAVNIGILSSLILPSEALWRRAAYEMRSPLVSAVGFSPFTSGSSIPSPFMVLYAMLFLAVALALAVRLFGRRDL